MIYKADRQIMWACIITFLVSAPIFIMVERKQKNPCFDLKDFTNLLFFAGAMLCFLAGVLSSVALFFDTLYLHTLKEMSAETSGIVLFAIPLSVFLVSFLINKLINCFGIINCVLIGLALACMAAFMQLFFSADTSLAYILFSFVCLGSIWSFGNSVSMIAAQTAVGSERAGAAMGTMVTMFNIGGSIGITIAVVIFDWLTGSNNDLFINGFSGIMWFLLIISTVLLLTITSLRFVSKSTN
jgi:predicted MFS family arabinose efflux permease